MADWPPTLDQLKTDMKIDTVDAARDVRLTQVLDAAIAFVQRARPNIQYDSGDIDQIDFPEPTDDLVLGTLRLAARWDIRRRSPDGLVTMNELGTSRVTSYDVDIDRLLRIGRSIPPQDAFA